jgi:nucleotide-binding universal stress UspA family protein
MPAADPFRRPAAHQSVPQSNSRVVLVGVDGSTTSLRAATFACGLARRDQYRLIVVHVVTASAWEWVMIGVGKFAQQTRDDLDAEIKSEIRALIEGCPGPVSFISVIGDPTYSLSAIADQVRADIVVVGASHGWRRWCGISVATRLIRISHWPIIVIP